MKVRELSVIETKGAFSAVPAPIGRTLPKYVQADKTRHGKTVYYFRRDKKRPRVRLWAPIGSADFLTEYSNAMAGIAKPRPSYVYFARSANRVKIGVSKNPNARAADLRTGSSTKIRIYYVTPGDVTLERELHRLFHDDRVNGEWFIYSQRIRDWIAADESERTLRATHPSQTLAGKMNYQIGRLERLSANH